jgi:hypothetical protein
MRTPRIVAIALVAVGLATSLSGCRYYWYKPQSTADMFVRDSDECWNEGRSAMSGTRYGVASQALSQEVYRACLQARGYERQKTTAGPDKHRGYEFAD